MINYIRLMNWFWREMPYRDGYKSEYGIVFLAIVDLCNHNDWRETSAEYDRMINKARVSKRLYYEAIKWLQAQDTISYQRGFNDYAPAKFGLKVEVQIGDTTATTAATQVIPLPPHNSTATDTTAATTAAPIINKPINRETEETKEIESKALPEVVDTSVKRNGNGQMIRPTLDVLTAYVTQHGGDAQMAQTIFNFYGSKGWKVGKNPMDNWNLAASGWINRDARDSAVLNSAAQEKKMVY